jgi:hypothetical protein
VLWAEDITEVSDAIVIRRPGVSFSVDRSKVVRIIRHEDKTVREVSRVLPPSGSATAPAPKPSEPALIIRLLNGSEIVADKIWVQGDRVVYERRGFKGSVRAVDVYALIDEDLQIRLAACRQRFHEAEVNIEATQQAGKELRREGYTARERAAIADAENWLIRQEVAKARQVCDQALAKWGQNMRMLEDAQKRSER